MSIIDEKWHQGLPGNGEASIVWLDHRSKPAVTCDSPVVAQAIAVLPEALALLKEHLGTDSLGLGHTQECYASPANEPCVGLCARTRDVLRRAGVLP